MGQNLNRLYVYINRAYSSFKIRLYSAFPILLLVGAKTRIVLTVIKFYQAMTIINKIGFLFWDFAS